MRMGVSRWHLSGAISAIRDEMYSAIGKHGFHKTPLSWELSDEKKLVILVEEVGEVARAMTYDEGSEVKLYKELIQVATMAAAWAQCILDHKVGGENGTDGFTSDSNV